jgi:hypothetical protein
MLVTAVTPPAWSSEPVELANVRSTGGQSPSVMRRDRTGRRVLSRVMSDSRTRDRACSLRLPCAARLMAPPCRHCPADHPARRQRSREAMSRWTTRSACRKAVRSASGRRGPTPGWTRRSTSSVHATVESWRLTQLVPPQASRWTQLAVTAALTAVLDLAQATPESIRGAVAVDRRSRSAERSRPIASDRIAPQSDCQSYAFRDILLQTATQLRHRTRRWCDVRGR